MAPKWAVNAPKYIEKMAQKWMKRWKKNDEKNTKLVGWKKTHRSGW
jgi:hypothetical protein